MFAPELGNKEERIHNGDKEARRRCVTRTDRRSEALELPLQLNWKSARQKEDESLGRKSKHGTLTQGQTVPSHSFQIAKRVPQLFSFWYGGQQQNGHSRHLCLEVKSTWRSSGYLEKRGTLRYPVQLLTPPKVKVEKNVKKQKDQNRRKCVSEGTG